MTPMPVMTTRRVMARPTPVWGNPYGPSPSASQGRSLAGARARTALTICRGTAPASDLALDVLNGFADGADALRLHVGDGDLELRLQLHHQLDHVQRIGADVVL